MEGSLVSKMDLQASYFSRTYCCKTSTRPPSCAKPRQPTMYNLWSGPNLWLEQSWTIGPKPVGRNEVFTIRPKYYDKAENRNRDQAIC